MQGEIRKRTILNREVFVYLPNTYHGLDKTYPVIHMQDGDMFESLFCEIIPEIENEVQNKLLEEHIVVGMKSFNRLDEYTPWCAKANDKRFPDFGGKGKEYLEFLTNDFSLALEKEFRISNQKKDHKIMGHSLGGLIALYSIFQSDYYGKIAGICSSQWYQDWISFLEKQEIKNKNVQLILLAGKKEGIGKTTIQKDAVKCSEIAYGILKKRIGQEKVTLQWDNYDHHSNLTIRLKTALEFLMK